MRLSLIERMLKRIPLPYPMASIAIVLSIVMVGISLSRLIDTGDIQGAFYYLNARWTSQIVFLIGNLILPIYALLSVRHMKNKVTSKEAGLIDISPEGKTTLDKVFKTSASTMPAIIIAALLLVPTIINQDYAHTIVGPVTAVAYTISLAIVSLIYASFLWTYISLVRGLYQLGKQPLKLTPFYVDNTLGLKPLGNLSMRLSSVYFVGLFLILIEIFINPQVSISTIVEIALLIVLGIILFFLPLYTAHRRLIQEKERYLNSLRSRLDNAFFGIRADNITFEKLNQDHATGLIAYNIIEQKISLISSWPIDPTMVRTLTALAISTATTLAGRLLLLVLHF